MSNWRVAGKVLEPENFFKFGFDLLLSFPAHAAQWRMQFCFWQRVKKSHWQTVGAAISTIESNFFFTNSASKGETSHAVDKLKLLRIATFLATYNNKPMVRSKPSGLHFHISHWRSLIGLVSLSFWQTPLPVQSAPV